MRGIYDARIELKVKVRRGCKVEIGTVKVKLKGSDKDNR